MAGKRRYRTEHGHEGVARLEAVRARLGWSAQRMAEALGVSFRTYQKWLYAGQRPRHMAAILARAEGLGGARRLNCWEVMECGRGPAGTGSRAAEATIGHGTSSAAGSNVQGDGPTAVATSSKREEPGICKAALDASADGVNGGKNAGRVCWAVAGTFAPGGRKECSSPLVSCLGCSFFHQVLLEEGLAAFRLLKPGQTYRQE